MPSRGNLIAVPVMILMGFDLSKLKKHGLLFKYRERRNFRTILLIWKRMDGQEDWVELLVTPDCSMPFRPSLHPHGHMPGSPLSLHGHEHNQRIAWGLPGIAQLSPSHSTHSWKGEVIVLKCYICLKWYSSALIYAFQMYFTVVCTALEYQPYLNYKPSIPRGVEGAEWVSCGPRVSWELTSNLNYTLPLWYQTWGIILLCLC